MNVHKKITKIENDVYASKQEIQFSDYKKLHIKHKLTQVFREQAAEVSIMTWQFTQSISFSISNHRTTKKTKSDV